MKSINPSFFLFLLLALVACEQEWNDMDVAFDGPEIVVEGYIENGPNSVPPYVILTKSSPYLTVLTPDKLDSLFVHGADVRVFDGTTEAILSEVCLSELAALDSTLEESVLQAIGLSNAEGLDSFNFCVYTDLAAFFGTPQISPEVGRTYDLSIHTMEGQQLSASTTLTPIVPLDTIYYQNHPSFPQTDSLVEVRISFQDPADQANHYRVFTKQNSNPMYPQGFQSSVSDDKIVNGQEISFFVQRGQPITEDFDTETFGYFWRGDTVTVRFGNIDYEHFRFWQTSEYNTGSQGPFGSYVRIESNIDGGLGIWGGISYEDYTLYVDP